MSGGAHEGYSQGDHSRGRLGYAFIARDKNIPKEMLPIYNKPVIQYVVEEAQRAKIQDVIFVTNRDKSVIEDHFDYNLQLEAVLERAGKLDKLREVRQVAEMVNIMSVRQKKQLGLGHAVLCAHELVRDDPFAIMVGDDLMFGGVPGIGQLIEVAMAEKMPVIGVMEVPWEKVSRYGIIDGEEVAPGVFPGCATWWKSPSARPRLRGWRSWAAMCSRRRFSTIWKRCSRATAAKSSLPTPCRPWPRIAA